MLEICSELGVAVMPFGGGTSVVGGVEPLRDGFDGVITLDLTRLDRLLDVDAKSLTATLEAGMMGPAAEAALAEQGLTIGHFPQSFEYSTVGGWLATALGRPGLDRLRAHRRAGGGAALRGARRGAARGARARLRRRDRPCASCWWAPRACWA